MLRNFRGGTYEKSHPVHTPSMWFLFNLSPRLHFLKGNTRQHCFSGIWLIQVGFWFQVGRCHWKPDWLLCWLHFHCRQQDPLHPHHGTGRCLWYFWPLLFPRLWYCYLFDDVSYDHDCDVTKLHIQDSVGGSHQYPDLPELSPDPGQSQISFQVLASQYLITTLIQMRKS